MQLGVNIDHIATIRQARYTPYPDIVAAALLAEQGGADYITVHLREDRRHIIDADVPRLLEAVRVPINLEVAATAEMQQIVLNWRPPKICVVPEKRAELTTEGGLDVAKHRTAIAQFCDPIRRAGVEISLFIDPDEQQIEACDNIGVAVVELHTGQYAMDGNTAALEKSLTYAKQKGFKVNAGHGLTLENVGQIAALPFSELHIGHAIVSRALFVGLAEAVAEMRRAIGI